MNEAEERLKQIVELSRLYDIYGPMLNEHHRTIFEEYILDNFSLAEIADEQGISRQGVRDIVIRDSKKLVEYEQKLGFLKKSDRLQGLLDTAINRLDGIKKDKEIMELSAVLAEMKKELDE